MKIRNLSSCILPALLLASCYREPPAPQKAAVPVRVFTAEEYVPAEGQRYSASILPKRQLNLAFRTSGFVAAIHQVRGADGRTRSVEIGDMIQAGTVLGQVRTKDYELQLSQAKGQVKQATDAGQTARAQLAQAEAAAAKAEQDFGRADALYKQASLTRTDYDAAKANLDATRAQVEAARAQVAASTGALNVAQGTLGTANLALSDTSLAAPFSGVLVQRSVELGSLAGPGVAAFVLADISSVKATFGVSDIVVAHMRNGTKLSIYTEAFPSRRFTGFVSAIAAVADSSTRSFQVEVTIPNGRSLLRPGMIASLEMGEPKGLRAMTVVPLNAIIRGEGDSSRFAVMAVEEGTARRKPVELGGTYGDRIAIKGVQAGAKVIVSGATLVSDGDRVKVIL